MSFIFTGGFLEQRVDSDLIKIILLDNNVLFLSPTTFLRKHFRSASINNTEKLHSSSIGYCYQLSCVTKWSQQAPSTVHATDVFNRFISEHTVWLKLLVKHKKRVYNDDTVTHIKTD